MSGTKKTWAIGLGLLLVVAVIVLHAWMSGSPAHGPPAINAPGRPHAELNAGAPSHPAVANGLAPVGLPSMGAATYHNVRFDFAVDYPERLLAPGQESDNGDGVRFASKVDDADVRAYGGYNALEQSPTEMLRFNMQGDCAKDKITYRISKPTLVAYSCQSPAGRIVYEKVIMHDDTLATVRLDYDPREQARWAPVIKQMADSLRLGSGPSIDEAR